MKTQERRGSSVIIISFLVSFMLLMMPLPDFMRLARPEWVAMVVIYWSMALPQRVSVGYSWTAGLVVDVIRDSLLGQHALALALVSFITIRLHQRLRVYPPGQQAATVFLIILINFLIILWIRGIIGAAPSLWQILIPTFTTALVWPFVFILMRYVRRQFQVS
ncbi:MAG: rod shape-determining protein MreD [Gammaproteobacteria bacterium]|nr:rod shape-determining protein MreD [Gammaproteobacteria bacterium]MDH5652427.1 rod shape-determining protein MreD [Gammaproteobacteria bacterium]